MSLSQLVSSTLGPRPAQGRLIDLDQALFADTHEFFDSEEQTDAFWGALLWQIVRASPNFPSVLKSLGVVESPKSQLETIVVPTLANPTVRADAFYDLVVLSETYQGSTNSISIPQDFQAIRQGYQKWTQWFLSESTREANTGRLSRTEAARRGRLANHFPSDFAVKMLQRRTLNVVLARFPEVEYTAVPSTPMQVTAPGLLNSTAGAIVQDSVGALGVTACRHGILNGTSGTAVGTAVTVGSMSGTVKSEDVISDSCFVELPALNPHVARKTTSGPLIGGAPQVYDDATFDGCKSGSGITAKVTGFSPDIPVSAPNNQLKIFTDAVTSPGDSGAALIDRHGYILGFAFWVTKPGAFPSLSAWIWAHSVFQQHGLSAL